MSVSERILKNTGYLYIKLAVSVFVTLYSTRIVLQALGASDFGIFGLVGSAIAMLGFLNTSLAAATQRFMNFHEGREDFEEKKKIFNVSIVLHFIIAIGLGILLFALEPLMFDILLDIDPDRLHAAKWIYRFTIVSAMFTVMTVPYDAVINSHENMLYYSIVGIISVILKLLIALYICITPFDKLIIYGLLMTIESLFVMVLMRVYCLKKYPECIFKPKQYYDKSLLKAIASFGGWNLVGTTATLLSNHGAGIIINNFFGTVINASASVCRQITGQMLVFTTGLAKAVNPVIVKSEGSGNRAFMFSTTFTACKLSFFAFVIIGIPYYLECNYILNIWLVSPPPYCLQFCKLVFFLKWVEQVTTSLYTSISAVGKIKSYNIVVSLIQVGQIILMIVFFSCGFPPYYEIMAMIIAASTLAAYKIYYCHKYAEMPLNPMLTDVLLRCLTMTLLVFLFSSWMTFLFKESFVRLICTCILTFVLNIFIGYTVLLNQQEKRIVINIQKHVIQKLKI